MVTVPEATKKIVERSRYLSEAISKDLVNLSSLARYIKPELEDMLVKDVSQGSVVMALKRLQKDFKPKYSSGSIFKSPPEMVIRSGMFLVTLQRTKETEESLGDLFINRVKGLFSSISIGATEIQVAGSQTLYPEIEKNIDNKFFLNIQQHVSQVTIYLPEEALQVPGVYYFFLKSLAWEGINILGAAPTKSEFTLFFEDKNVNRAFEILSSLFTKEVI